MGFNNQGVEHLLANVLRARYRGMLGINIGKNFDTPIGRAADDYEFCLAKVYPHASYVTVNVSSPNTKDLRQLQGADELGALAGKLKTEQKRLADAHGRYVPLVLKSRPTSTTPRSRPSPNACSGTSWTASSPPTPRLRAQALRACATRTKRAGCPARRCGTLRPR